jgi:hypothetical protein
MVNAGGTSRTSAPTIGLISPTPTSTGAAPMLALLESPDGAMARTRRGGQCTAGTKTKCRNGHEEGVRHVYRKCRVGSR